MVKEVDLDKLDIGELKTLAKAIDKALKRRATDNLKRAREAAEAAVRSFGYSLEQVVGSKASARNAGPSVVKYTNPDDPTQSWSGRGRQPRWFKDVLAAGGTIESLTVR